MAVKLKLCSACGACLGLSGAEEEKQQKCRNTHFHTILYCSIAGMYHIAGIFTLKMSILTPVHDRLPGVTKCDTVRHSALGPNPGRYWPPHALGQEHLARILSHLPIFKPRNYCHGHLWAVPQWVRSFCCSGWEHKARNGVCAPGRLRPHTPCPLLKNKPEVQCEGPWGRRGIRNWGEVSRRNLREDIVSTRCYKAVSAPTSPQSHIHTTRWIQGESVQKNKREVQATVLHPLNPAGFWSCSWCHSNPATRAGLSWWTREMNTRSSTVGSFGPANSKNLIHSAMQGLNYA